MPENIQADLIARRADVKAARKRVEATGYRVDEATASFYPNVNLAAYIGGQSLGMDMLAHPGSLVGGVGPALHLPVFGLGRLRGHFREARADYDAAVAEYDRTVSEAFRQVADVAVQQRALARRLSETRAATVAATAADQLAQSRYAAGLSSFLEVLSAENELLANRRILASLETRSFVLDVALVKALGGGFVSMSR